MQTFRGRSLRPGVALAAAARLTVEYGIPSLSPSRLRRLGERLRRFGVEVPEIEQVILVADVIPPGFTVPLPGLEIVGMAAQSADAASAYVPVVTGLRERFFESVEEGDIVIVDGDRGRVYVSPDAATVARYQGPTRSARRVFLGEAHQPARTLTDGRAIGVFAPARTPAELETAMSSGADGLVIPPDHRFFEGGEFWGAEEQLRVLTDLLGEAGGKTLLLDIPVEALALSALLQAAALGPLHLVLHEAADRLALATHLAEIEAFLEEQDVIYGPLRYELACPARPDQDLPFALDGFSGVMTEGAWADADASTLLALCALARSHDRPAMAVLGADWPDSLDSALSLGFDRVLVPADSVTDVKDAIRER